MNRIQWQSLDKRTRKTIVKRVNRRLSVKRIKWIMQNRRRELIANMTKAEIRFYEQWKLRTTIKLDRQCLLGFFIVDFYCPEKGLIIEIDGGYHNQRAIRERDNRKDRFFKSRGAHIIRFTNEQVFLNLQTCLNQCFEYKSLLEADMNRLRSKLNNNRKQHHKYLKKQLRPEYKQQELKRLRISNT